MPLSPTDITNTNDIVDKISLQEHLCIDVMLMNLRVNPLSRSYLGHWNAKQNDKFPIFYKKPICEKKKCHVYTVHFRNDDSFSFSKKQLID